MLSYVLFEAQDEQQYVETLKESLKELFEEVNVKTLYIAMKNLRKIIRLANRFLKYTSIKESHVQIYMFILQEILALDLNLSRSTSLLKIYSSLKNKLSNLIGELHEDLQYDYMRHFEALK